MKFGDIIDMSHFENPELKKLLDSAMERLHNFELDLPQVPSHHWVSEMGPMFQFPFGFDDEKVEMKVSYHLERDVPIEPYRIVE